MLVGGPRQRCICIISDPCPNQDDSTKMTVQRYYSDQAGRHAARCTPDQYLCTAPDLSKKKKEAGGDAAVLTCMLRAGRTTFPYCISCGTMERTMSMGMAKPTPAEVPVLVKMAVFTPTTRPCISQYICLINASGAGQFRQHCPKHSLQSHNSIYLFDKCIWCGSVKAAVSKTLPTIRQQNLSLRQMHLVWVSQGSSVQKDSLQSHMTLHNRIHLCDKCICCGSRQQCQRQPRKRCEVSKDHISLQKTL